MMSRNNYNNIRVEGSGHVLIGNQYTNEPKVQRILKWLSPLDPWAQHREARDQYRSGTLEWFLKHPTFVQWLNGNTPMLWCPGPMGTGKTVLMSATVQYLHEQYSED